jgi:hypothetical protein
VGAGVSCSGTSFASAGAVCIFVSGAGISIPPR